MYSSTSAEATHTDAAVAQSVERRIGSAEVTGPIPVSSLKKSGSFWVSKVSAFLLCLSIKKYYNIFLGDEPHQVHLPMY